MNKARYISFLQHINDDVRYTNNKDFGGVVIMRLYGITVTKPNDYEMILLLQDKNTRTIYHVNEKDVEVI